MDKRKVRQCAICLIFEGGTSNPDSQVIEAFSSFEDEIAQDFMPRERDKAKKLAGDCLTHRDEIDKIISESLKDWSINRIAKTDLAILRLAFYEIIYVGLPYKVCINEAVELAKIYSPDKSPSFINGVLGSYVNKPNHNAQITNHK